jgi:hypothetical protein
VKEKSINTRNKIVFLKEEIIPIRFIHTRNNKTAVKGTLANEETLHAPAIPRVKAEDIKKLNLLSSR